MRYLWIISFMILIAGVAVLAAGVIGSSGPIALICGLLLLWTGIVKIVVLRIWNRSMAAQAGPLHMAKADSMSQPSRSSG